MANPRIISLDPSCTDLVFALGREAWLCGVTGFCRKIPDIGSRVVDLELPSLGGMNYPRYELMEKLRPDLVLAASRSSARVLEQLVSRHFNVVSVNPCSWEDVLRNIRLLGWLLEAQKQAEGIIKSLQADVKRLQKQARKLPAHPSIYVETSTKPVQFAPDWVRQMVEFVGGMDIYGDCRNTCDQTDRLVDIDSLQRRDPDAIVLAWLDADGDHDWDKVRDRPGWDDLRAVREGRIFDVDARHLLHPGMALFNGLDDLAQAVAAAAQAIVGEELY
jgi:iron complex transport system substrate-binding protein